MGKEEKMIDKLENNVYEDCGSGSFEAVVDLEKSNDIKLPRNYVEFITRHNGAWINVTDFEFDNPYYPVNNGSGVYFSEIEDIQNIINDLMDINVEEPGYFYEKLIPFGDNGGGDFICFDYRECDTDNPPIIIWFHDVLDNSERIVFVANNFEEFVDKLHEPYDLDDEEREARRESLKKYQETHKMP